MKKYELTNETIDFCGRKLYRIRALIDFGNVKAGDPGGYVESENNLSHDDNAWVYGNAWVCDNADYICIHGFGSEYRTTTFYRTVDEDVGVRCGCFKGTLDEFREKVRETHGNSKFAKEHLMIADLMELHFKND